MTNTNRTAPVTAKLARFASVLSLALVPAAALAQSLPGKPIRMVVGFPSGGPIDTVARILAPHFVEGLGQQVIVDNRAGANGIIAMDIVAKAAPDGHTLFFGTTGNLAIVRVINIPQIHEKLVAQGIEPAGSTPQEFEAFWKSELTKWARVVKSANIRAE